MHRGPCRTWRAALLQCSAEEKERRREKAERMQDQRQSATRHARVLLPWGYLFTASAGEAFGSNVSLHRVSSREGDVLLFHHRSMVRP